MGHGWRRHKWAAMNSNCFPRDSQANWVNKEAAWILSPTPGWPPRGWIDDIGKERSTPKWWPAGGISPERSGPRTRCRTREWRAKWWRRPQRCRSGRRSSCTERDFRTTSWRDSRRCSRSCCRDRCYRSRGSRHPSGRSEACARRWRSASRNPNDTCTRVHGSPRSCQRLGIVRQPIK